MIRTCEAHTETSLKGLPLTKSQTIGKSKSVMKIMDYNLPNKIGHCSPTDKWKN